MAPDRALPISDYFEEVDDYVDSLLQFATSSVMFQTLCGGVHILDFFTQEPALFDTVLSAEWRQYLLSAESMDLLDLLMRDDLKAPDTLEKHKQPPQSLLRYIEDIRKHCLNRSFTQRKLKQTKLSRSVSVGMVPKKIHEVTNFASYVDTLVDDIAAKTGHEITHLVDFGSGQNYLGRSLASPPYNRHIVALESKENNINGAKNFDVLARVAERPKILRNKKLYRLYLENNLSTDQSGQDSPPAVDDAGKTQAVNGADFRSTKDLDPVYTVAEGKGSIQYVESIVENGDLSPVVKQISMASNGINSEVTVSSEPDIPTMIKTIESTESPETSSGAVNGREQKEPRLMTVSIHSCGNLSHHAIRSLVVNSEVKSIAIVGCCYNLLTERLGPPTCKHPSLRPNLRPINARVLRESLACDPQGFPMSERLAKYNGDGIRLNITARMMAVQAPQNWTEKESDSFFTRHYFRALLQKLFLDRGVVSRPVSSSAGDSEYQTAETGPTDPVIIGSLRKGCYDNFTAYVRGAVQKLANDPNRGKPVLEKMSGITNEEIEGYERDYSKRKKELSVMWSLMAFSAGVVESLIVVDRWLYLLEHSDVVKDCWVEPVFDYKQSPRNLVVVGVKE